MILIYIFVLCLIISLGKMSTSIIAVLKVLMHFFQNEMLFSFNPKSNTGFLGGKGQEKNTTESYKEICNNLPGINSTIWRRA